MHTSRAVQAKAMVMAWLLSGAACVKSPPPEPEHDAGPGVAAASATASVAAAPTGRDALKRANLASKDGQLWACFETPGVVDDSKTPEGWVSVPGKLCPEATDKLELASCTIHVKDHLMIAHYFQLHGVEKDDCAEKGGTWQETPDAGAKLVRPDAGKHKPSGT
jgi:hypothetical protein